MRDESSHRSQMTSDKLDANNDSFTYLKPREKDSVNPWKSPRGISHDKLDSL